MNRAIDLNHTRLPGRRTAKTMAVLIVLAVMVCCSWATFSTATGLPAEQPPTPTEIAPQPLDDIESSQETPSLALATVKAFGALAVVIGLLLLLAAALKKLGLSAPPPQGGGLIKVLDTKMLAPKKYVAVVDIAGQPMALGISDQQVSLLAKLEVNEQLQATTSKQPAASRFASLLAKVVNNSDSSPDKERT